MPPVALNVAVPRVEQTQERHACELCNGAAQTRKLTNLLTLLVMRVCAAPPLCCACADRVVLEPEFWRNAFAATGGVAHVGDAGGNNFSITSGEEQHKIAGPEHCSGCMHHSRAQQPLFQPAAVLLLLVTAALHC